MRSLDSVVLTGATGFLGRHLVPVLIRMGCRPVLLTHSAPPRDLAEDWGDRVRWITVDLRTAGVVADVLAAHRPHTLFHLAGTRGRKDAEGAPVACAELNVTATLRLLAAARRMGTQRVILVGSAEEYGNQPGPLHEGLPLLPESPYGISKAAATRFAQTMHAADGTPVVVLRPFSVYGPGQPSDMFLAEAVSCAVLGVPFRMSHGEQRRDLVFVDDVVRALTAAAHAPGIEGRAINVGSGQAYRLRDVAARIWQLTASRADLLIGARPPEEAYDTWADVSLARQLLQWDPQVDLDSGLQATIRWAQHGRA